MRKFGEFVDRVDDCRHDDGCPLGVDARNFVFDLVDVVLVIDVDGLLLDQFD